VVLSWKNDEMGCGEGRKLLGRGESAATVEGGGEWCEQKHEPLAIFCKDRKEKNFVVFGPSLSFSDPDSNL